MRGQYQRYECMYVNESIEFYLRSSKKIGLLLKNILLLATQL